MRKRRTTSQTTLLARTTGISRRHRL
jgi:hypothetical protein